MPIYNHAESTYIHVFINRYICTSLCMPIDRQRERERYCVCVCLCSTVCVYVFMYVDVCMYAWMYVCTYVRTLRVVLTQSETCLPTPGISDFLPEALQSSMVRISVNLGGICRPQG